MQSQETTIALHRLFAFLNRPIKKGRTAQAVRPFLEINPTDSTCYAAFHGAEAQTLTG